MVNSRLLARQSSILWYAADFAIKLGATRLIAFPLIAQRLSDASFGAFVTAMSIALILGASITSGYSVYIIKALGEKTDTDRVRTCLYLSALSVLATTLLFTLTATAIWISSAQFANSDFWFWFLVFAVHYVMSVQSETVLTTLRVERKFKSLAGLHLFGVIGMLAILMLPSISDQWAVSMSILVWAAIPMAVLLRTYSKIKFQRKKEKLRKKNIIQIAHFFLTSLASLLTDYIDRVLIAIWWPAEVVSTFFAAASLAMLMCAPALIISNYLLSMLSKVRFEQIRKTRYFVGYLLFISGVSGVIYLMGSISGVFLLELLYPKQYEDAVVIYDACLISAALISCSTLLKPIVIRYHVSIVSPVIASITLIIRFTIAYYLIRNSSLVGASQAMMLGAAVTSLIWLIPYFSLMSRKFTFSDTPGN